MDSTIGVALVHDSTRFDRVESMLVSEKHERLVHTMSD